MTHPYLRLVTAALGALLFLMPRGSTVQDPGATLKCFEVALQS